jgi:hypothetical protein
MCAPSSNGWRINGSLISSDDGGVLAAGGLIIPPGSVARVSVAIPASPEPSATKD